MLIEFLNPFLGGRGRSTVATSYYNNKPLSDRDHWLSFIESLENGPVKAIFWGGFFYSRRHCIGKRFLSSISPLIDSQGKRFQGFAFRRVVGPLQDPDA